MRFLEDLLFFFFFFFNFLHGLFMLPDIFLTHDDVKKNEQSIIKPGKKEGRLGYEAGLL